MYYKAVIETNSGYLVHFNKNHSPTNGQFATGDGDGDGIADDHKNQRKYVRNSWGIKNQYQNKDGTLTSKGKKSVESLEEYKKIASVYDKEYWKLRKNKNLKEADDVDDKTLEKFAKKEGLNTKAFHDAYTKMDEFEKKYEKYINSGREIYRHMLDVNPSFSQMTPEELYNSSAHLSDVGSTFISAFFGLPTLTTLGLIDSIGSGVSLARYEAEQRKLNRR